MIVGAIISIIFLLSIIISWYKIITGKKIAEFIYYWGFPLGAFVWEDLFVFSFYGLICTLITMYFRQGRLGLLFFIIFWIVRSGGESLYFFLQQFVEPKQHPHFLQDHYTTLRKIFGNISYQQCSIIMQVMFQIILMFSIVSLTLLLFSWNSLL